MARSRSRSGGGRQSREPKATSKRKPAEALEVEIVEEGKGLGIDDGIILITAVMLVVAFFLTDFYRGKAYGEGMFFKGSYEAPAE